MIEIASEILRRDDDLRWHRLRQRTPEHFDALGGSDRVLERHGGSRIVRGGVHMKDRLAILGRIARHAPLVAHAHHHELLDLDDRLAAFIEDGHVERGNVLVVTREIANVTEAALRNRAPRTEPRIRRGYVEVGVRIEAVNELLRTRGGDVQHRGVQRKPREVVRELRGKLQRRDRLVDAVVDAPNVAPAPAEHEVLTLLGAGELLLPRRAASDHRVHIDARRGIAVGGQRDRARVLVPFAATVRRDALADDHDLRFAAVATNLHLQLATLIRVHDER